MSSGGKISNGVPVKGRSRWKAESCSLLAAVATARVKFSILLLKKSAKCSHETHGWVAGYMVLPKISGFWE